MNIPKGEWAVHGCLNGAPWRWPAVRQGSLLRNGVCLAEHFPLPSWHRDISVAVATGVIKAADGLIQNKKLLEAIDAGPEELKAFIHNHMYGFLRGLWGIVGLREGGRMAAWFPLPVDTSIPSSRQEWGLHMRPLRSCISN